MVLHGATGPLEPPQAQLSDVTSVLKNIAEDPGRVLVKAELSYPAVCIDGRPYRTEPGLLPQSRRRNSDHMGRRPAANQAIPD